ncbi:anti-restriction protein [Escherichia coli TA206]|nr:anti-restriction protein [Escherichia coli TA206]
MRRVLCTRRNKDVAAGSAFTRPCGAWPCGFSGMNPPCRVRAVPCLHRSRASAGGMQRYASPLRSPGPSFPSAVIFRSFTRSGFAASPCNSRQPCASGCGFPCAPASLQARQRWRHGTARCRGICDYGGFGNVCCCTCCIRWNLA